MHSRFIRSLVAALAVGAVIAPGAAASGDLRSPDARDAASAIARDTSPAISVDLRSPDARDAALDRVPVAPATRVALATTPTEASARDAELVRLGVGGDRRGRARSSCSSPPA